MTGLVFSTADLLTIIGAVLSLLAGIGVLIYRIGKIVQTVKSIESSVEDIPKIKYSFAQMSVKLDVLWRANLSKSNSPIILSKAGKKILTTSNIDKFTEKEYSRILFLVKKENPYSEYRAQEILIKVLHDYQDIPQYHALLQNTAFNCGYDVTSMLYVAAINIRDRVLSDLGFKNTANLQEKESL